VYSSDFRIRLPALCYKWNEETFKFNHAQLLQKGFLQTQWQTTATMATTRSLEVQASTNKMCNNNNRLCKETMVLLNLLEKFRPTPMSQWKLRSSSFRISMGNRAKTPLRHSNSWPALTSVKSPTSGTTSLHFHTSGWRSMVWPTNGSAQSSAICTSQLPKKHGPASGGLIQASFQSRIACFLRRKTYHRWTRQTFTQAK